MKKTDRNTALLLTLGLSLLVMLRFGVRYPYHIHNMEGEKLFVFTGDYFTSTIAAPGGLITWLGAFFTQFFYYSWLGAAIIAAFFAAITLLAFALFKDRNLISFTFGLIPACCMVVYLCGDSPCFGIVPAAALVLAAAALVLHFLKAGIPSPEPEGIRWYGILSSIMAITIPAVCLVSDQKAEKRMEYGFMARMEMWNRTMTAADKESPSDTFSVACLNLALGESGRMDYHMFDYRQVGMEGLIPGFAEDWCSASLAIDIYQRISMDDEAIALAESCPPEALSAQMCKAAARAAIHCGNETVYEKYDNILKQTLFYKHWDAATKSGGNPKIRYDYLLAGYLLEKDVEAFAGNLDYAYYPESLPKAYQQALLIRMKDTGHSYDALPPLVTAVEAQGIDYFLESVREEKDEEYMMKYFGKTYWRYYYSE